jgi:hypothetical protein
MSTVLQPKHDYSTWPTKQDAATLIGVSTKTIENYVKDGKIKQAKWQRPTGGPLLAVYDPEDVNRLAHRMSAAVIVDSPGAEPPARIPKRHMRATAKITAEQLAPSATRVPEWLAEVGAHVWRIASEKASENSEKLFLTIPEAAHFSGLTETYLRRACRARTLAAIKDGGWKIPRAALRALQPPAGEPEAL